MLAEFPIEFHYRPGKENVVPDALSRHPFRASPADMDIIMALTPFIVPE